MAAITKEQIRRVYALGAAAGILQSGNKDDNLHAVVRRISGKDHVSQLTGAEFIKVEQELLSLTRLVNRQAPFKPPPKAADSDDTPPGMINKKQIKKAWALMYNLIGLDEHKSSATPGQRMTGVIKKVLGVDAETENPFQWITFGQGFVLIDALKQYIRSAERRAEKRGSG